MICLKLNRFFYDPNRLVVYCNFLNLFGLTDGSKISSDQKRLFFAESLYHLLFFANTPFNPNIKGLYLQVTLHFKNAISDVQAYP